MSESKVTRKVTAVAVIMGLMVMTAPIALGQALTIHEIQSNTSDGDASVYDLQIVDCVGGVCCVRYEGTYPRLILQDPNSPDGWGRDRGQGLRQRLAVQQRRTG